jgi:hypothetical protein
LRIAVLQVNEALGGGSFVEDEDDPFEGLTPEEIQARAAPCWLLFRT